MKLAGILTHPLTHRIARHTHDYGLYLTLAMFQKEFYVLMFSGAMVIVMLSYFQLKFNLDDGKDT